MRLKVPYVRSKKLLEACRELPCQSCGSDRGTVVAAHSNWARLGGKGMGMKADDRFVAALCCVCHHQIDQGSRMSGEDRLEVWTAAWRKTVKALVDRGLWPSAIELPEGA